MRNHRAILSVLGLLAGCVEQPAVETEEPEVGDEEPRQDSNEICGENTVASARAPTGNRVVFCVHDDVEIIAESGPFEPMPNDSACALDTFLALTDASTPVPARLVESCAMHTGAEIAIERTIVPGPVFTAFPKDDVKQFWSSGNYCAESGEDDFRRSCPGIAWGPGDLAAAYCKPEAKQSSLESIYDYFGQQGNSAEQRLASCGGTSLFRGLRDRGSQDSGYIELVRVYVQAGETQSLRMNYAPASGADAWFKFQGASGAGTYHRHSGYFYDDRG